jgi:hypothetical protein
MIVVSVLLPANIRARPRPRPRPRPSDLDQRRPRMSPCTAVICVVRVDLACVRVRAPSPFYCQVNKSSSYSPHKYKIAPLF